MLENVSLHYSNKFMMMSASKKRARLMKLENIDGFLKRKFKWCIIISIVLGMSWNLYEVRNGSLLWGIADMVLEYLIYPAVILLFCHYIEKNKFDLVPFLGLTLLVMLCHTPSYSLMLVWCIVFVVVRFQLSGLQSLPGYPNFQNDMKGKKDQALLTEDQRFAKFKNDVNKNSKLIWHDEAVQNNSEDILSGKLDIDGYFGVNKTDNPGVMEELIIPDDLDLEGNVTENASKDDR